MVASIILVFAEENLGDPIEIRVDVVHPAPVTAVAFPAAIVPSIFLKIAGISFFLGLGVSGGGGEGLSSG
nr:hypothetical protein [Tanacetum cinerariifolium]